MKYIPITQEIFNLLTKDARLVSKPLVEKFDSIKGEEGKENTYDFFLHPTTNVPFAALRSISKYIYNGLSTDPFQEGEEFELDLSPWILKRIEDLDDTFMLNSYTMFGINLSDGYKTLPTYGNGIYELSLPQIGFTKKIWVKLEKYYDWSDWDVGLAYKNMINCFNGTYYNMNLKQHYLNIIGAKLYELNNNEKGS
jgi:hypothetical protein